LPPTTNVQSTQTGVTDKVMGCSYGFELGCAKARLGPKGHSETCPYGGLGLSSSCLEVCVYSDDSELVHGRPSPYSLVCGNLSSYQCFLKYFLTDQGATTAV